ncbi:MULTISPECIES: ATP-binding protein [Enterobacterales]|jgi:signal transduction histidine kinase|uniref:ATP-binding protein n=1 Tax=Enterobacterales TaxID=91347 RepID=UPI0002711C7A|nr:MULTISPECIES: ATP-binding protein [Enterobacterales]KAJ9430477.1 ATP-binding protein [Pantoea sp. YR343]MBB3307150.1 signal transduction histidine kinase [Enterobacter sp. Sphag1F]NYI15526.1 signal transduction histidine kinase [Enterobacter sp. Sphag71]
MKLWPRSLLSRLLIIVLGGLLLANTSTLISLMIERMSSAKTVMLGNLEYDVATSVAILDRLPAAERPLWLAKLARANYRYELSPGEPGPYPTSWRSLGAVRSLQETLAGRYQMSIHAIPGTREHIQVHLTLHDGAPLTLDLWPRMPAIARWLPLVLTGQLLLLLFCAWLAVRQVVRPFVRFTQAVNALKPTGSTQMMAESGPAEVQQAARAFNAMQTRIQDHLKERAQILAAISHDLQTPITRMKLRVEMAEQLELREKLLSDLDNMSQLVREGIAYARSSDVREEKRQKVSLNAFLDSVACDYQDVGKMVSFVPCSGQDTFAVRPQALHRVMTNLIDNALKFGSEAEIQLCAPHEESITIHVLDNGPGIPDDELKAVLEPFYRVESSRNRHTGGTGLGLAIASQLVGQMSGTLNLSNRPEGGLDACVTLRQTDL